MKNKPSRSDLLVALYEEGEQEQIFPKFSVPLSHETKSNTDDKKFRSLASPLATSTFGLLDSEDERSG